MLIEKILQHYTKEEEGRDWSRSLRASSAGKCARAIGYQYHGFEAEPLPARSRMVFRMGDLVEQDMVDACKESGVELINQQEEVKVEIGGIEIKGHIDGQVGSTIVDFKSINTLGFKRVEKGHMNDSYVAQMHFYLKAKDLTDGLFVFYNKDTSLLYEAPITFDPAIWHQVEQRYLSIIKSTKESLPAREYKPNDKGVLPWQCAYCSFSKYCWKTETSFKNGKPVLNVKGE